MVNFDKWLPAPGHALVNCAKVCAKLAAKVPVVPANEPVTTDVPVPGRAIPNRFAATAHASPVVFSELAATTVPCDDFHVILDDASTATFVVSEAHVLATALDVDFWNVRLRRPLAIDVTFDPVDVVQPERAAMNFVFSLLELPFRVSGGENLTVPAAFVHVTLPVATTGPWAFAFEELALATPPPRALARISGTATVAIKCLIEMLIISS